MLDVQCSMFNVQCSMFNVRCSMFIFSDRQLGRHLKPDTSLMIPRADNQRNRDSNNPHHQGGPGAEYNAAQNVVAEVVGSQEMMPVRLVEALLQILGSWMVRRCQWSRCGGSSQHHQKR